MLSALRRTLPFLAAAVLACQPPGAGGAPSPAENRSTPSDAARTPAPVAATPAPPARVKLDYMVVVPILNYWHQYVAQQRGFFEAEHLEIEFVSGDNASRVAQALTSGSVNLGGPAADTVINAVERGGESANLVIVGGEINKMAYQLVASRDVHSYADLRGKTLAVIGLQDGSTVVLKRMLAANGLRDDDYGLIPVGGTANRAAAVTNGTAAGALIGQPQDFRLTAEGFPSLGISADVVPEYPLDVIAARKDWAQQNPDVVVRFLRAIVRADRWLYDPANREDAARVAVDVLKLTPEEGLRAYNLLVTQYQAFPREGEISMRGLETVIESMQEIGLLQPPLPQPEKYVDQSYLRRATAERTGN